MTMKNSDNSKNGEHHLPFHGFGDHETHPSMAHNLIITLAPLIHHHQHMTETRQDHFDLTKKHQPLSHQHIALVHRYKAVQDSLVG